MRLVFPISVLLPEQISSGRWGAGCVDKPNLGIWETWCLQCLVSNSELCGTVPSLLLCLVPMALTGGGGALWLTADSSATLLTTSSLMHLVWSCDKTKVVPAKERVGRLVCLKIWYIEPTRPLLKKHNTKQNNYHKRELFVNRWATVLYTQPTSYKMSYCYWFVHRYCMTSAGSL